MRRLLLAALLVLGWGVQNALPVTCTFSADGLWSGGGSCGVAPTTVDDCVVNASVVVHMDSPSGVCGTLTANGHVILKEGARTLKIGDGAGAKNDQTIIDASGSVQWVTGQTVEVDTSNQRLQP